MKEIVVSEQCPDDWIVSRRMADPVAPEVFDRVLDEVCEGVREDNHELRQSRLRALAIGGEIILD